jgi:membrane protein
MGGIMQGKRLWELTICAVKNWFDDNASALGAALAFYCAFSLAPLLVLLLTLASHIVGPEVAYSYVGNQLSSLFGAATADVLIDATRHAESGDGVVAAVISVVTLLIGATTVFAALENALDFIWGSKARAVTGLKGFIRSRLLSFGFILAMGFLLLISLTLSTALAALHKGLMDRFSGWMMAASVIDMVLTTLLSATLFAFAYRYMPATRLAWRTVAVGALVTALLFQFGRWAIGLYLGNSTQPSAFGAAASFVALLLWLYYSAQIFLFGAEFTACFAGLRTRKK